MSHTAALLPCCLQVSEGFRPPRPHHLSDAQWELVCRCWHQDPCERPPMAEVAAALNHMISELIEVRAFSVGVESGRIAYMSRL
mgnify:CR=1 FL=1